MESYEPRRIRSLHLHSGWAGKTASLSQEVHVGRGGVAFPVGDPSEEEWEAHDRWVQESCEHEGYLISESLGNITRAQHLREFLRGLQGNPGPKFPICSRRLFMTARIPAIGFPSKSRQCCCGKWTSCWVLRYFDRRRKRVLSQHEASVRGQHRNRQSDYVLMAKFFARDKGPLIVILSEAKNLCIIAVTTRIQRSFAQRTRSG